MRAIPRSPNGFADKDCTGICRHPMTNGKKLEDDRNKIIGVAIIQRLFDLNG